MSAHIHAYQTGHGGGIYLHCDPVLSGILRRQVAGSFRRLHPDVNLYIIESGCETAQEALLNASADFGLYFSCQEEHPILDSRILDEDELVYCFGSADCPDPGQDNHVPVPVSAAMQPRRIMLAPKDSALRLERDGLLKGIRFYYHN